MHISVITLFPEIFQPVFGSSIIKRAQTKNIVQIDYTDIRKHAVDSYGSVDDHPYGGGPGMVLRVDVLHKAILETKKRHKKKLHIILTDPAAPIYTQQDAQRLSKYTDIAIICGHYEGFDERIRQYTDESISIGKYVLTGGEIPTMVIIDSIVRILPGTLHKTLATENESFSLPQCSLEYPQYTKPKTYRGNNVPDVLLSGNHKDIEKWKVEQSKIRTQSRFTE